MFGIPLKILSIGLTVAGAILTLLSNAVEDKKMEEKIDEALDKKLAERNEEEES